MVTSEKINGILEEIMTILSLEVNLKVNYLKMMTWHKKYKANDNNEENGSFLGWEKASFIALGMVLFKRENVFWQKSKILLVKDSEIWKGYREHSVGIQNVKNGSFYVVRCWWFFLSSCKCSISIYWINKCSFCVWMCVFFHRCRVEFILQFKEQYYFKPSQIFLYISTLTPIFL